CARRDETYDFW
nr:immunoglobulin heavy chain junction region [Macaca mulatta]MOV91359.1 immunoglobulin heavy chain junction region [Macaca mulatta]